MEMATPTKIATCKGASRVAMKVRISTAASSRVERRQILMWRRLNSENDNTITKAARAALGRYSISGKPQFAEAAISRAKPNV